MPTTYQEIQQLADREYKWGFYSDIEADEAPLVTRARHRDLVEEALAAVERALEGARIGIGAELVSEDLRLAARALGRITGSIDAEDLLDRIFSQFCVGK